MLALLSQVLLLHKMELYLSLLVGANLDLNRLSQFLLVWAKIYSIVVELQQDRYIKEKDTQTNKLVGFRRKP